MNAISSKLTVRSCAAVIPDRDPQWASAVPPADRRRSPRIWQMASVASQRAHVVAGSPALSAVVVGTALGALEETRAFLEKIHLENTGSPRNFIASVHNSMAGKLALDLGVRGPNLTMCEGQNSFAAAITAAGLLDSADMPVLLVAVDERIALLDQLAPHLSPLCRESFDQGWTEGAVAFVCDRSEIGATLRAWGPAPVPSDFSATTLDTVVPAVFGPSCRRAALGSLESSLLGSAIAVADAIGAGARGTTAFVSIAPSTRAIAAVELCA